MVPTITIAMQEWKERQDQKNRNDNYKITPGPQSDSDNYRQKGQIRNMAWRQTWLLSLCGWVYILLVCVSSRTWFPVAPPAPQRPHQEKLSRRKKKKKKERKKNPHPPKPPHVPFSCLCLLRSHDPLTEASPPVEYHMFPVKPNFFFFSSLKGQAVFSFFFFCRAQKRRRPHQPPELRRVPRMFQIAEVLN